MPGTTSGRQALLRLCFFMRFVCWCSSCRFIVNVINVGIWRSKVVANWGPTVDLCTHDSRPAWFIVLGRLSVSVPYLEVTRICRSCSFRIRCSLPSSRRLGTVLVVSLLVWFQVDVEQYVLGYEQAGNLARGKLNAFDDTAIQALCCARWQIKSAVVHHGQHAGLHGRALRL